MHMFDNAMVMTEGGVFVNEKWIRLQEILNDWNMDIELRWIPPQNRSDPEKSRPYAICQGPHVIMFASEDDNPVEILATLWRGRTDKHNVYQEMQIREKAEEVFRLKRQMEEREALHDEFHYMLTNRSPYTVKRRRPDGSMVKIETVHGRRIT